MIIFSTLTLGMETFANNNLVTAKFWIVTYDIIESYSDWSHRKLLAKMKNITKLSTTKYFAFLNNKSINK